ncbi:kinase-like domain-containing protein [Xylariaceae sp. FL0594]|nr:kinase-like domain-containing protein [Xylariaceae sp. FL0594]
MGTATEIRLSIFACSQPRCGQEPARHFPPAGRPVLDMHLVPGDEPAVGIWYEDGTQLGQYIRLFDIPGTLSGDILRLPRVDVDSSKHFLKKAKYRSEIENLIKCQGGSCPGTVLSPHIVRLLGASADGQLVFEKLSSRAILARFSSLETYRRWILHIIDALSCLHSLGIVHRDLRIDNFLFTEDGSRLVVCDLESRWGQRAAPEVALEGGVDDSGWTTRSDIYDIGDCIKGFVYANVPITNQVEWPVPEPLQAVVEACMRKSPDDRPTLLELRNMVEAIPVDGC